MGEMDLGLSETEQTIESARWHIVEAAIEKTPLNQKGLQEVGLWNGVLNVLDSAISRLPKHPFIQKFRMYAGSQLLKKPIVREENAADLSHLSTKELVKHHQENYSSDLFTPDFVRARRRLCINELLALPKDGNGAWDQQSDEVIRKMAYLDAIGYQMVTNQRKFTVHSKESGTVSSIATIIKSPVEAKNGEASSSEKPLAIVASGYGNDFRGGATLATEIALSGQDVVHLSYPDSYHETEISDEFVNLVENSPGLTAHAEYFKAFVRELIKANPGRKIELWGQSTGSLVWATALSDRKFAELIDGAVLIHPAGSANVVNQKTEFVKAGKSVVSSLDRTGMYSWVVGATNPTDNPFQKGLKYPGMVAQSVVENGAFVGKRGRIWKKVMANTKVLQPYYDLMELKNGNKVLMIHGAPGEKNPSGDTTTMSFTRTPTDNEISINYDGGHADTNIRPDDIVHLVMDAKREHAKELSGI